MSVKKSIAIYNDSHVDDYEQAVEELKREGKITDDTAEGERLATLAREYTSNPEPGTDPSALWDMASITLGIIVVLLVLFGGFAALMIALFPI